MEEKQVAVFCRKASDVDELAASAASPGLQKTRTAFQVEKVVVLSDAEYAIFRKEGFMQDQIFLFENGDQMWFDPSEACWHVPFPVSWTVKMKKKQKETQDILSYHTQAAGCSDKARAKASGGRQPIEECGRTGL